MSQETLTVRPGPKKRTVYSERGELLDVPDGWELLPPGDAGLTRKVKSAGPTWTVKIKKGRRTMSRGVWAPKERIERAKRAVATRRASPAYQRQMRNAQARRERDQRAYVRSFETAVRAFLAFDDRYALLELEMAKAIAAHATPVGSGTVARTQRIPVEQRAEAAVIAWMRHQTTAYDHMRIPRKKGARRKVRRMLAERSRTLLEVYRKGLDLEPGACPLRRALSTTAG